MSNLRKIISGLLVLCMVLAIVPPVSAAQTVPQDGRVVLDELGLAAGSEVWVDGIAYEVQGGDGSAYVDLPADANPGSLVTYSYYVGNELDIHTQYPSGMNVWALQENPDGSYTPAPVDELEDILQYSGSSIRITGNKGIRMITSIDRSKKAALISEEGLSGYTLLEYGTVLSWASALADGSPLVLGREYAKSNFAYKKGEADPIFKEEGNLMQYTNVLVGFSLDECADDIAMRSYMILQTPDGEEMTVYGGIVTRSIGYIAWQNRNAFAPGTAAYNYVWEIIRHVYGEIYTVDFEENGGSEVRSIEVPNGTLITLPENPEKGEYPFTGWYTDAYLTDLFDFTAPVTENLVLYADYNEPITRGRWIHMLVDAYGYPTDAAEGQTSYDDIAESPYRTAIETAVIYSVLDPAEDGSFHPDEFATREFAALTLSNCMGYQPDGTPDCADAGEITHAAAVRQALDAGWMALEDGYFHPVRPITSEEARQMLLLIEGTFSSAVDSDDTEDGIVFLENVVVLDEPFDWESEGRWLIIPEDSAVPEVGQIITFGTEKAIRVDSVEIRDGTPRITYSIPEMYEYLDYIDVHGTAMMDFSQFIPAEGVTVSVNSAPSSEFYGFADDWFDVPPDSVESVWTPTLEGDIDLGQGWKINYSMDLNIPSVSYMFDVDFDANPFNDEPAVNVKNAYIKLQNDITIHVDIGNGVDTSDEEFEDSIYDDILEKEVDLGSVPLIGMDGLGAVVEIDLVITAEGNFEIDYNVHGTIGVQVLNNQPRNISALQSSLSLGLAATLSVGPRLGLEVEIFDEDILDCYAEIGAKAEGSIHLRSTGLLCMDANCHMYAELSAFESCLIDDWLDITIGYEIWDASNSPVKVSLHWENFEKVDQCTYEDGGTIKGTVANADNRTQYIQGAKIEVFDHSTMELIATAVSDARGEYTIFVPDGGTVLIRITANGYIPCDDLETVGVSQITYLETLLLVEGSEDPNATGLIGGTISDAVSGQGIDDVALTIYRGWNMTSGEVVDTVYTSYDGSYSVSLPLGNYTIVMTCDGYVSGHFNVAVTELGNWNCNGVMNPDGSSAVELGDLRIILIWADEPADLDSHLWGPTVDGTGSFHIYWSNKNYNANGTRQAYLDVDDRSYIGPETITVYNMNPNGIYSYYIHDYTNRNRSDSTVMANSGAYIQVFVGETRVAVYHVPTSGVGTVWHVFDFNAAEGRIYAVNEFSHVPDSSAVGRRTPTYNAIAEPVIEEK